MVFLGSISTRIHTINKLSKILIAKLENFSLHDRITRPLYLGTSEFQNDWIRIDFSKKKMRMSCQDTYTILPNNLSGMCTILLDGYYKGYKRNKEDMETRFMEDYNCLECEHFNRCSLGCFLSHDLSETRTQEECWLKEVYDYVDTKSVSYSHI